MIFGVACVASSGGSSTDHRYVKVTPAGPVAVAESEGPEPEVHDRPVQEAPDPPVGGEGHHLQADRQPAGEAPEEPGPGAHPGQGQHLERQPGPHAAGDQGRGRHRAAAEQQAPEEEPKHLEIAAVLDRPRPTRLHAGPEVDLQHFEQALLREDSTQFSVVAPDIQPGNRRGQVLPLTSDHLDGDSGEVRTRTVNACLQFVPVLDGKRVAGIVTGGDLIKRAGMPLRLDIQSQLPDSLRKEHIRCLDYQGLTAKEVMSSPVATLNIKTRVPDALALMAEGLNNTDIAGRLVVIPSTISPTSVAFS